MNGISCCPSQPEIKKEMKNKQDRFYLRNEIKELRQAVSQNLKELTVEKLEQLVKGKKDINPTILDAHCGATILHLAAISGKLPIVEFYTNQLEDPNPQMEGQLWDCSGYTPLHLAAVHGHLDIVKHYFNIMIKVAGITDCFEREIDYDGNDIERTTTLSPEQCQIQCQGDSHCRAWTFNGHNKNCFLKTSNSGKKASLSFVTSGPKNCIFQVAKAANGNTPLHEASKAGWIPMVEFMVDRINDIAPKNEEGETPKDLAEKSGHKKIVEILQNEESKRG